MPSFLTEYFTQVCCLVILDFCFYFISLEYFIGWKSIVWLVQRVHAFHVAACRRSSTRALKSCSDGFWSQTPGSSFKDKRPGFHSDPPEPPSAFQGLLHKHTQSFFTTKLLNSACQTPSRSPFLPSGLCAGALLISVGTHTLSQENFN